MTLLYFCAFSDDWFQYKNILWQLIFSFIIVVCYTEANTQLIFVKQNAIVNT